MSSTLVVLLLLRVSDYFDGSFFSFVFRLCASLMPRLDLVIMLLQRLDVTDIILILIYSLYQKKKKKKNGLSEIAARAPIHHPTRVRPGQPRRWR
jgi:hypothetical protein